MRILGMSLVAAALVGAAPLLALAAPPAGSAAGAPSGAAASPATTAPPAPHPAAATPANDEARHSGVVVGVAPDGSSITIDELVAAPGPKPVSVKRTIRLNPDVPIEQVRRGEGPGRTTMPGWATQLLRPSDLKPGDFVTVTTRREGGDHAVALEVVPPGGVE